MTQWQASESRLKRAIEKGNQLRTSTKPHWVDARQRLEAAGISLEDVVLAEWRPDSAHFMTGLIVTRDGRVIDFDVTYDYDESKQPLPKGVGWISSWEEVAPELVRFTSGGHPNTYAQAVQVAQLVFQGGMPVHIREGTRQSHPDVRRD